jgi:hypothetical protein
MECNISLLNQQRVITHTVPENEIPALLDSRVTNITSVEILCPQNNYFPSVFVKNIKCLRFGLISSGKVFFVSAVKLCVGGLRQTAGSCAIRWVETKGLNFVVSYQRFGRTLLTPFSLF